EVVGRGRQVHAEVDAAQLVDSVEAVYPDRRLPVELVLVLHFAEKILDLAIGVLTADAVCVVSLIVEYEDVLFPAHLAADDAVHEGRVALHVADRLHPYLAEVTLSVAVLTKHAEQPGRELPVQLLLCEVPAVTRGGRAGANRDRLHGPHRNTGSRHLRTPPACRHGLWLEDVPVGDEHSALGEVGHQMLGHQVSRAIEAGVSLAGVQLAQAAPDS